MYLTATGSIRYLRYSAFK